MVSVEVRLALFAVLAHRVVLAVVADAASHVSGSLVGGPVEVAARRVRIAVAALAFVRLLFDRRMPRDVVVEVLALLAVQPFRVMRTLATTVHLNTKIDTLGSSFYEGIRMNERSNISGHVNKLPLSWTHGFAYITRVPVHTVAFVDVCRYTVCLL